MSMFDDAVNSAIKKQWLSRLDATKLITNKFQEFWLFVKGTRQLTKKWQDREKMTKSERAIDRYAKSNNISPYKLRYTWWRVLVKWIYKK